MSIFPATPTPSKEFPYDQDGLKSIHNHDFIEESEFLRAYNRGVTAAGEDYRWHWRVHVGLWAAHTAHILEGDFVECGVNRGFLSSAIMESLDWDKHSKIFYLLDTFEGLSASMISEGNEGIKELQRDLNNKESEFYTKDYPAVQKNFSSWANIRIIKGIIPQSLKEVTSNKIAFLHLDLNCAPPEVEALDYFWPKLVRGAIVLMDDYAYYGYEGQKKAMDVCISKYGLKILSLPTGQGILIKNTSQNPVRSQFKLNSKRKMSTWLKKVIPF